MHGIHGIKIKYQVSSKSVQLEPSCSTRTDRHDKVNNRFSSIFEGAYSVCTSNFAKTEAPSTTSLKSVYRLVSIMGTQRVFCAVRNKSVRLQIV
jgi:hypothetical protein